MSIICVWRPARCASSIGSRTMNPYDPNLANLLDRLNVWMRGLLWRYRRPLLVTAAAAAVLGVGVNAVQTTPPPLSGQIASR